MKVEIELPHEEYTKTYCPKLCPFSNTYRDTPCILKEDLDEPVIIEGRNFQCDDDLEYTPEELREFVEPFLNPMQNIITVVKQPGFVQMYFRHNCCPLWAMRKVYGDDWQEWFSPNMSIINGVATYPLRDHLQDVDFEVRKKLKEKKEKKEE